MKDYHNTTTPTPQPYTTRRIGTRHSTGSLIYTPNTNTTSTPRSSRNPTTNTRKAPRSSKKKKGGGRGSVAKEHKANSLRLKRRRELLEEGLPVRRWCRVLRKPVKGGVGFECWVWIPREELLEEEEEKGKVEDGTVIVKRYDKSGVVEKEVEQEQEEYQVPAGVDAVLPPVEAMSTAITTADSLMHDAAFQVAEQMHLQPQSG